MKQKDLVQWTTVVGHDMAHAVEEQEKLNRSEWILIYLRSAKQNLDNLVETLEKEEK